MLPVPPDPIDADPREPEPQPPNPLQINQYHLAIIYLNYSPTMIARALRHHKYPLPKNSLHYWEHRPHY